MAVYSRIVYASDLFPLVPAAHKRMPKYDLLFTILFAFLWLVAASAWAHGVGVSIYQRPVSTLNKYIQTVGISTYYVYLPWGQRPLFEQGFSFAPGFGFFLQDFAIFSQIFRLSLGFTCLGNARGLAPQLIRLWSKPITIQHHYVT